MRAKNTGRCCLLSIMGLLSLFLSISVYSATPLMNIIAITRAPTQLAVNASAEAIYRVTNNASTPGLFVMQPIQGISLVTTTTGACRNPISLGSQESCLLKLRIRGNQILSKTVGGPVICNQSPHAFGCSQPSNPRDVINITTTLADSFAESNAWINVLIEDGEAPGAPDQQTYINKIYTLAPSLEQFHIRVVAGANGCPANKASCQAYADYIADLRTKYTNPILIGYHPDDSRYSFTDWQCTEGDWQCVLNASIIAMNAINAIADPTHTGQGFNIFSLEQSYAVPADSPTLRDVKACLNPPEKAANATCPVSTVASPVVSFGWVLPSYGGCVVTVPPTPCDNEYGTDALDYGYPQYYNLGTAIGAYTALITDGYLPLYSTTCLAPPPYPDPLYVVDEDNGVHPYNPQIPCVASGQSTPNVFTYPDQTTGQPPNIPLASAYLGFIMTQLPPISDVPDTNDSSVYITFSGEGLAEAPSLFLGAPGWTTQAILQFYNGINANFNTLYGLYPPPNAMFSQGVFQTGVKPSAIKYAIWNFSSILDNMP
jgi:hypothetical protein